MTDPFDRQLARIAERLAGARRVLFVTGAGISADSGLPTYRGVGGLYEGSATAEGLTIEQALSGPVFAERPEITWKYLAQIERGCRGAKPNAAHQAIVALERRLPFVMTLTQNVDGLHRAAGSANVVEIHGNLHRLACTRCGWRDEVEDYASLSLPPSCPRCLSLVRPDVVLFGEALPMDAVARLSEEVRRGFDLVFSIGTSSRFPYVVAPLLLAAREGTPTVEINPEDTELSALVEHPLRGRAAPVMAKLMAALR